MTTTPARDDLLDTYVAWMRAAGFSDKTIRNRVDASRSIIRAAGSIDDITTNHLITYIGRCRNQNTRATYYAHATALARFLVTVGRDASWIDGVPRPKMKRGTPRPIDDDELFRALDRARGRARLMLILAAYQGLRVHEIAKLRGDDVTSDLLHVVGKGQSSHELPTHPLVWRELQSHPRTGWVFLAQGTDHSVSVHRVYGQMTAALRAVGSQATPHQLRHWYGTQLLRNGANLRTTQELLRHASLATTAIYTLVTDADRRDALAALPTATMPTPDAALSLPAEPHPVPTPSARGVRVAAKHSEPAPATAAAALAAAIQTAPAVIQAALRLYAAGLAGREIVGLPWSSIDLDAGCVIGRLGVVTLTPAAVEALREAEHGGTFLSLRLGRQSEQTVHMTTDAPTVFAQWTVYGWRPPLAFGDACRRWLQDNAGVNRLTDLPTLLG